MVYHIAGFSFIVSIFVRKNNRVKVCSFLPALIEPICDFLVQAQFVYINKYIIYMVVVPNIRRITVYACLKGNYAYGINACTTSSYVGMNDNT